MSMAAEDRYGLGTRRTGTANMPEVAAAGFAWAWARVLARGYPAGTTIHVVVNGYAGAARGALPPNVTRLPARGTAASAASRKAAA
jgi:hypothetical protein